MNRITAPLFITLVLSGCANTPSEVKPVNIPVPVYVSCPSVARAEMVKPKDDSRVEWLRAELVNHERLKAYASELEATLDACK